MKLPSNEWLRRKIESDPDEPEGCPACGAIAGACSNYPNCPGGNMSYSFSVKGATKAEAIDLANKQFDDVEKNQPAHKADMPAARTALVAFIDLLVDDSAQDCGASVSGYLSWNDKGTYQSAVNISTGLQPRK
jgi:hypothetical protein